MEIHLCIWLLTDWNFRKILSPPSWAWHGIFFWCQSKAEKDAKKVNEGLMLVSVPSAPSTPPSLLPPVTSVKSWAYHSSIGGFRRSLSPARSNANKQEETIT